MRKRKSLTAAQRRAVDAAHAEWWRYQRYRWLSGHPGRSARDFDRQGPDVVDWLHSKGAADRARERRAWQRSHPGQRYPEHECGLSTRAAAALWKWRRKYWPRSRTTREFERWRQSEVRK